MSEKKISVVLPVYNGDEYLKYSIESIIAQTYANWELIIVNDCSTDDTPNIITKYMERDTRIKCINNEINQRLPKSLNIGFASATGEYFTWTSDDNIYRENAFEVMAEYLDGNPQCSMVYSDYTNIDAHGNETDKVCLSEAYEIVSGNVVGASFLYRREAAALAGTYDANLFLAEDYDYWIQLYKNGELHHLSRDLYQYRRHENSLSATRVEQVKEAANRVINKNFLFLYYIAKKYSIQYRMFDSMLMRVDGSKRDDLQMLLTTIDGKYACYLRKKNAKRFFATTKLWNMIRQLRDKIVSKVSK